MNLFTFILAFVITLSESGALVSYVDFDALTRLKLATDAHPIAKQIASCYPNNELTSKAELSHHAGETLYGEITFRGLEGLLEALQVDNQDRFFDLGSGTGKTVLQVALAHHVHTSQGVELVAERHSVAEGALECIHALRPVLGNVTLHHGSMFDVDLSAETIIYVNSLALTSTTLAQLGHKLLELPGGAMVATLKHIPGDHLVKEATLLLQMNFGSGPSEVFLYRRKGRSRAGLLHKGLRKNKSEGSLTS